VGLSDQSTAQVVKLPLEGGGGAVREGAVSLWIHTLVRSHSKWELLNSSEEKKKNGGEDPGVFLKRVL